MAAPEVLLTASRLEKAFGARRLVHQVSLGICAGERIGLIGDNGAGKSTLLRMLAGLEPPDAGAVVLRGGVRVAVVPQVPRFSEPTVGAVWAAAFKEQRAAQSAVEAAAAAGQDTTALLALVEALGGWDVQHHVARVAQMVGLDGLNEDTGVSTLSGGQAKRLALGRMVLSAADLIFLDEPTNHLDTHGISWLEEWLVKGNHTALVVTHDRAFLEAAVERMAELRDGHLRLFEGSYGEYVAARAELEAQAARADSRRAQILRQEVAWAARSPSARGTRQKGRLTRLAALQAQQPAALARAPMALSLPGHGRAGAPPAQGKTLVDLRGVQVSVQSGGPLFEPFSLPLRAGERWGVLGANGVGKTSLLKLIQGALPPCAGTVVRGPQTQVALFDQHRTRLDPKLTVGRALSPTGADFVVCQGVSEHVSSYLSRFGFGSGAHTQSVAHLSGGERHRLALAQFLLTQAWVLLLDEPTNDIDLLTLSVLEDALVQFAGALVVVSHDRYFLDKVATGTVAFVPTRSSPGASSSGRVGHRLVAEPGDWRRVAKVVAAEERNFGVRWAKPSAARPPTRHTVVAPPPHVPSDPSKRPLTFTERHRLGKLEREVAAAEVDVSRVQAQLADPNLYVGADGAAQAQALGDALASAQAQLESLMAAWTELAERE